MNAVWWFDDDEDEPDLGGHYTATEAERALGIPATRIRKWAQRRRRTGLEAVGHNWRSEPLYWEADLRALERGERVRDEHGNRRSEVHL